MDVLRAKHLRVNQLPPAELKELKICPVFPHAPAFSPLFAICLSAHWLAGKSVMKMTLMQNQEPEQVLRGFVKNYEV